VATAAELKRGVEKNLDATVETGLKGTSCKHVVSTRKPIPAWIDNIRYDTWQLLHD
jgi:hypothetical protein